MAQLVSHPQLQQKKMKGILKQALKRRPISIQSLKKSLSINHSNLEGFVKYIRQPPPIFQTSTNQENEKSSNGLQNEISGLRNIVKNINVKTQKGKEIFLKRNSFKGQIKRELKLQRSELKLDAEISNELNQVSSSFHKGKINGCLQNFKQKIAALDARSIKMGNHRPLQKRRNNNSRNTFSVNLIKPESQNQTPNSSCLWKKYDKAQSTHRRWKTEEDDKGREKTLGEMTKYCERKNMKGINYLVLQLQLNVEDSKRMRQTTGPFY